MKCKHLAALDWVFVALCVEVQYFSPSETIDESLIFNLPINILSCNCQGQKQSYDKWKIIAKAFLAKIEDTNSFNKKVQLFSSHVAQWFLISFYRCKKNFLDLSKKAIIIAIFHLAKKSKKKLISICYLLLKSDSKFAMML